MSDTRGAFGFDQSERRESIPDLVRQLTEQGTHLAQQQANLVQAEIRSGVTDLREAAGAMAGAAVVGLAGLGVTLMGVAYLLAEAMELWLATLIVGLVTLAAAYAMFAAGKKKLQSRSLSVDRTRRTIERAPGAISGNQNEVHNHGR
ncbi:MAG TPA: phage holin family protein [Sphingomicrobium sp.]|nr:phage holin family protein [Sphingomicrobium sp.]